jgi:hypothetical protein
VNFRREAAARAAERLIVLPPVAPAATTAADGKPTKGAKK